MSYFSVRFYRRSGCPSPRQLSRLRGAGCGLKNAHSREDDRVDDAIGKWPRKRRESTLPRSKWGLDHGPNPKYGQGADK
jgi:hypothetical protein